MPRHRLSARHFSTNLQVEALGLRFTAPTSNYPDGRLGEIFLQNHKADSAAGIMASDAAIAASLALQYGCPVEVLRKALCRDARGKASGPLGAALDILADF
jgi:hypothetical protein